LSLTPTPARSSTNTLPHAALTFPKSTLNYRPDPLHCVFAGAFDYAFSRIGAAKYGDTTEKQPHLVEMMHLKSAVIKKWIECVCS
jgi:hypothetical protein